MTKRRNDGCLDCGATPTRVLVLLGAGRRVFCGACAARRMDLYYDALTDLGHDPHDAWHIAWCQPCRRAAGESR